MKNIELDSIPSIAYQYLRTVVARKPGTELEELSELASVSLPKVKINKKVLKQYRTLCGFSPSSLMPVTFPTVLTLPLQMELLLSNAFPHPLFGLVHIRNKITHYRNIEQTEVMDIGCRLLGPRRTSKGEEFDVEVDCFINRELSWSCVSTYLKRKKSGIKASKPKEKRTQVSNQERLTSWHVAEDVGRRYGKLSGDINPIHMYGVTAKLFGFPRAIAHGMWTHARCISEISDQMPEGAFRVEVGFKQPLYLPSDVDFYFGGGGQDDLSFSVRNANNGKTHLEGTIHAI